MKLTLVAVGLLAGTGPVIATPYSFTALPAGFTATALNSVGQIAGSVSYAPFAAALYQNGTLTPFNLASNGSAVTAIEGINDAGDLLVESNNGRSPYLVVGGVVTGFTAPGNTSAGVQARALNDARQVAGSAQVGISGLQGYLSSGSTYVLLNVPGAFGTAATGLDNAGDVVGTFTSLQSTAAQGFVYKAGVFTTIDLPGAVSTLPAAINDAGVIAGTYSDGAGNAHGFIDTAGLFSDVTGPGGAFLPVGLDNEGQLLGTFGGTGPSYLATPLGVSEPATVALLAGGLVAFGGLRRHRPWRPESGAVR